MADPSSYRPKPGEIPVDPGVYKFRDKDRRVIYVGKAKSLRSRLSSYFQDIAALHPRTRTMVTTGASVEWTVVRKLDGLLQGDYRTLFRGLGLDFADLREYQLHDDIRHIDWNVTARTQVTHVRVYNEDRDITAWFLLDLSPSVDVGSAERAKREVLTEFVGVMARLLVHHGNKVGAILFDGVKELMIPPRAGRRQLYAEPAPRPRFQSQVRPFGGWRGLPDGSQARLVQAQGEVCHGPRWGRPDAQQCDDAISEGPVQLRAAQEKLARCGSSTSAPSIRRRAAG